MLAFEIRYLLGRVTAADYASGNEKDRVEWPPHPDRLFCALVQAWADLGRPDQERALLLRLEDADQEGRRPLLYSRPVQVPDVRRVSFVPVNDNAAPCYRDANAKKDKSFPVMGALRLGRDRKERRFVSSPLDIEIDEPHVIIGWPGDHWTDADRVVARRLARQVGHLGHSSSVVYVEVVDEIPTATCLPDDEGTLLLRVPHSGRLAALENAHSVGRRPPIGAWRTYGPARTEDPEPVGPWRDMVIYRFVGGPHALPIVATLQATHRLRAQLGDAWRSELGGEPPRVLTGHPAPPDVDGDATTAIAVVPLPDVGHAYADGHLLGVAVLLAPGLRGEERRGVLRVLGRLNVLSLPRLGQWQLERQSLETPLRGLLPDTWTAASTTWATVTPVVFDRDPGDLMGADAESSVSLSCERLGQPRPFVQLSGTPFLSGSEHAREFPLFRSISTGPKRRHMHVLLRFDTPIRGPLALGAGRHLGYGLCRPLAGEG